MYKLKLLAALAFGAVGLVDGQASQSYTWKNVKIGGGGGFVPGIIFNPSQKGLAYARTDIGGAYKLNSDDTWTPLLDFADNARWNYWGVDALATDPVQPNRLYLATGMYTNSWDPNNGQILISSDSGSTFTPSSLPFKIGGNMPGRGIVLFFGARSGNGLWKSTDYGKTWAKVTGFTDTGSFIPDSSDTSGYNSDKIGIAWVTFDKASGSSGSATPRIFVGVANKGSTSVYVSTNGGSSWSAVAGQPTDFLPHKGVLSPAERSLYISYSDGAGPYDGTGGAIYKYNIDTGAWTNITPVSGGDLYFGFGGVAVDLQKNGTVMVAALNSWWPDGQIFRSIDGGASWTALWAWNGYPNLIKSYSYDDSLAPWIGPNYVDITAGDLQIGWMMESIAIDPFDSNHWLYGTGETIYGSHDLLKWDTAGNVTIKSLADGIEETSVQALISPPSGPPLISAIGDVAGFVHESLTTAPKSHHTNPDWATSADIDFAGNNPSNLVRIGTGDNSTKQVAISSDYGVTWNQHYGAPDNVNGGKVAISANADTILWRTSGHGVMVSQYQATFSAVSSLPSDAAITSDKKNNAVFYGASTSTFYLSTDIGKTFSAKGTLGSSTSVFDIAVHPNNTGDVWVSTDKGLFHSTNNGTSFTTISGISQAWGIALGAPKTVGGYPAIFVAANYSGVAYLRSDDQGVNWVKINDAAHGFGSASSNCITADARTYGRVYIGTNGRGIFYGDASGSAPSPTATATSTTTSTTTSATTSTHTTTTSAPTSTSSTTFSSSSSSSGTQTPASGYGQCGGQGWTGPTTCVSGYTCVVQNDFYSQCVPS
ncbi:carbohydrate-binding module family 1 protein [Macrolepiota fuliginosa MF-IS2]|uniref:Carbohydrate-binding module family 1 protein n=1 Tax=Macrolepiota fuliginosa MF-IS2 TaxID=1400762 RepID=A0A9P5X6H7_9AGAR|nr:carbohydrate-binding module family 1 protein [Macrolepiota fuliginosa MF-IS2]